MAETRKRPLSPEEAPDTARVYERARPEAEAGMGRLDNEKGTPTDRPDGIDGAVSNKHASHQINAHELNNAAPERKSRRDLANEKRTEHRRKNEK